MHSIWQISIVILITLQLHNSIAVEGTSSTKSPMKTQDSKTQEDFAQIAQSSPWNWNEASVGPLGCMQGQLNDYGIRIESIPSLPGLRIAVLLQDLELFHWRGHRFSVFQFADNKLYFVDWNFGSSGGQVVSVDLKKGKEIWRSPLKALGDIEHSVYLTRFNLQVNHDVITIWGNETHGRYVEFKSIDKGETIGHRIFPKDEFGVDRMMPDNARTNR